MNFSVKMMDALHGARGVEYHPERLDLVAIWHGGHSVRIYSIDPKYDRLTELTVYNIGDFGESPDAVTYADFRAAVEDILLAVSEDY